MHKSETPGANAVQMTAAVLLGGLLALGVELVILLLGAVAVARGILKESAVTQVTVISCVVGCFIGGWFSCGRWPSRRLFAGLAAGAVCFLLILAVGLLTGGDGFELGLQALMEVAACLCGGALAGLFSGKRKRKRGGKRVKKGK